MENVDDSSEYTIDSEDIEEGEPEAFEVKDEKVKIPEEDPEEKPEETAEDLEALREEKGQDLAKKDIKALEKKKREEKGGIAEETCWDSHLVLWLMFTQALIMQKLEEVKSIEGTLVLLDRDHPARKALEETIAQKKEEMKKIQAERQKARGRSTLPGRRWTRKKLVLELPTSRRGRGRELLSTGSLASRQELLPMWQSKRKLKERFNQLDSGKKGEDVSPG